MFSIGDDELDVDLDDEEFLLAACGIPQSSSNCNVPTIASSVVENTSTSTLARKPLNSLTNSCVSNESRRIVPCRDVTKNQEQTGSSNLNIHHIKTLQTFNCKSSLHAQKNRSPDQGDGPPSKKTVLSCGNNFANSSEGLSNASNTLNSSRNTNKNRDNSLHLLATTNKTSNLSPFSSTHRLNSPVTSCNSSSRSNMSFTSPVSQSSAIFHTPDQRNHKQTNNFTPKGSSGSCDVTPSRKKSARKFPGPAGLLPKLNSGQSLDELSIKQSPVQSTSPRLSPNNLQQPMSSQCQTPSEDEEFSRDPWIGMFNEYKQNVPELMRYTILQVISEAAGQRLKYGKVPSLCVLVKTSSPTETDSSIFLKDPTGEIHGTLHKKVLEEYPSQLGPGAGIILKQVSVFSPSTRKHYLNITPGNIIHIYPPDPSHVSCSQPLASQGTQIAKQSSQQRISIEEPEIILEKEQLDDQENEATYQDPENFNDLLEGLDHEDDILDEDLLAMY